MDESLSDMYGDSECSGKPSNNVYCDMPVSCKSFVYTQPCLADLDPSITAYTYKTWSSSVLSIDPLGKICSHSTTKHGNSSGEWLQTEHTSVIGSKAKHESSEPMVRSGSRATVYPVPISDGQVLVDTCGHN